MDGIRDEIIKEYENHIRILFNKKIKNIKEKDIIPLLDLSLKKGEINNREYDKLCSSIDTIYKEEKNLENIEISNINNSGRSQIVETSDDILENNKVLEQEIELDNELGYQEEQEELELRIKEKSEELQPQDLELEEPEKEDNYLGQEEDDELELEIEDNEEEKNEIQMQKEESIETHNDFIGKLKVEPSEEEIKFNPIYNGELGKIAPGRDRGDN